MWVECVVIDVVQKKSPKNQLAGSEAPAVDPVAGKTVAEILGEITWLMTQDPRGREMKISEIERLVMPAILQRRFHIKYAQIPNIKTPEATTIQPVTVEIFSVTHEDHVPREILFRFSIRLQPIVKTDGRPKTINKAISLNPNQSKRSNR